MGLLALLCVWNVLRRQVRVAMGMMLTLVAVLLYVYVQVSNENDELGDVDIVAPPPVPR